MLGERRAAPLPAHCFNSRCTSTTRANMQSGGVASSSSLPSLVRTLVVMVFEEAQLSCCWCSIYKCWREGFHSAYAVILDCALQELRERAAALTKESERAQVDIRGRGVQKTYQRCRLRAARHAAAHSLCSQDGVQTEANENNKKERKIMKPRRKIKQRRAVPPGRVANERESGSTSSVYRSQGSPQSKHVYRMVVFVVPFVQFLSLVRVYFFRPLHLLESRSTM